MKEVDENILKFFAKNPKVPDEQSDNESEGQKGVEKILKNISKQP